MALLALAVDRERQLDGPEATDISLNLAGTDLDAEQVRELTLKEATLRRVRSTWIL